MVEPRTCRGSREHPGGEPTVMAPTADVIADFIDDHRRADRLLIRIKALPWGIPVAGASSARRSSF
ncbi:hypothetical protein ACU686_24465 [Yinghuangia aomiensis]